MRNQVRIFDTTLRDGEQTPGVHLTVEDKAAIAGMLEAYGVDTIEAGFPVSSPGDEAAVSAVAATVVRSEVAALCRCRQGDIDAAVRALRHAAKPVIHVFLGTSDIHLRTKLGMTREEGLAAIRDSVAYARAQAAALPHPGVVEFSPEDATRTDPDFLRACVQAAVEAGAARINVPDTVGCATPGEYATLISHVVRWAGPAVMVSAHCHDDMGLATANSIAAVGAGARQVECTVNGIGERAGNTSLEQVGVVLFKKEIGRTGLDLSMATAVTREVAERTGVPVQPNRPVVGANAFAHSAGIHQHGILKNPANYEFVSPGLVGAAGHRFVMTARSGRSALAHHAAERGMTLSAAQLDAAYRRFKEHADRARGEVPTETVHACIEAAVSNAAD